MIELDKSLIFPPVAWASEDGLLAYGGDLSKERIWLAYSNGIFPWYGPEEPILWWCPDPRFVVFPAKVHISDTMKSVLKKNLFKITFNQAFGQVLDNCASTYRKGQDGTWLNAELQHSFTSLHQEKRTLSVEAWQNNVLVGGLYGVVVGNVFCGESMFAHVSNASKAAFISLVKKLEELGFVLIDCQVHTPHLESLGAEYVSRELFLKYINQAQSVASRVDSLF